MSFLCMLSIGFALGRIAIGVAPFLAVAPLIRLFGFSESEDTATARLFARFFGVREIGLGVLVLCCLSDPVWLRWSFAFNALHDLGDAFAVGLAVRAKPEMRRPFLLCGAMACGGGMGWGILFLIAGL